MRQEWVMIVTEFDRDSPVNIYGVSKADCLRNFAGMADTFKNVLTIRFRKINQ
jgi:hypothetical protein